MPSSSNGSRSSMASRTVFANVLLYPTIQILAGPDKKSIIIHEHILSSCSSSSLRALVNGNWKEAHERVIDWSDTDLDTVLRLLSFLYTADYDVPIPKPLQETSVPLVDDGIARAAEITALEKAKASIAVVAEEALVDISTASSTTTDTEATNEAESADYRDDNSGIVRPLTPFDDHLPIPPPKYKISTAAGHFEHYPLPDSCSATHDFTETLLSHARLYTLANRHLLRDLETLCLQRLTQTLARAVDHDAHLGVSVVPLIRFVYDNTPTISNEPMRKLISQFTAIHNTSLNCRELDELLCEGGDFVPEYFKKLSRRLRWDEEEQERLGREVEILEVEKGERVRLEAGMEELRESDRLRVQELIAAEMEIERLSGLVQTARMDAGSDGHGRGDGGASGSAIGIQRYRSTRN